MSLFSYKDYRADAFDQFSVHALRQLKPIKRRWYWRPWHTDDSIYDTLEQVPLWSNVDDHGACLTCGGVKSRPKCTCPRTTPEPLRVARSAGATSGEEVLP